ncbi:MAG: 23S rRNA (pseudouridine(1915)-N(3))-methyltransferase RlmH, partial [Pseudomonadota bacterium]
GVKEATFALGGADGHSQALRNASAEIWSFGAATWPHMLARVMLAEQLYRAASILGGRNYHHG